MKDPLLAFLQSTLPVMVEAHAAGMTETLSEVVAALRVLDRPLRRIPVLSAEAEPGGAGGYESDRSSTPRMVVCRLGV